eukprot:354470-Chlamydomonas_euryale.AAC.25
MSGADALGCQRAAHKRRQKGQEAALRHCAGVVACSCFAASPPPDATRVGRRRMMLCFCTFEYLVWGGHRQLC